MLNGSYIGFRRLDISPFTAVKIRLRSSSDWVSITVTQESPDSEPIGFVKVDIPEVENRWNLDDKDWFDIEIPLSPNPGIHDLYFICHSDRSEADLIYFDICQLEWLEFIPYFDN